MNYNFTAYYETEEERIKAIAIDILRDYPSLGDLALKAAMMEEPFGKVPEDYRRFSDDENRINRLIDIVIVTEGRPEFKAEYNKACEELLRSYDSWSMNFTYANPEEQAVYLVMDQFYKHMENKEIPLITVKQAKQMKKIQEKEPMVI